MQDTIYQPSEKSILLELMNPTEMLTRYEHNLRGEIEITQTGKDEQGREIVKRVWSQRFPKKMSDVGINWVISYLQIVCDKTVSMTDISEEEAAELSLQDSDDVLTSLNIRAADFGLTDAQGQIVVSKIYEVYTPLREIIITRIHSCVGGMMVNAVAKTFNVSEQKTVNPEPVQQEQSRGILSMLRPRV
jgi:hypothetical protein